jgi:hypothetical protein
MNSNTWHKIRETRRTYFFPEGEFVVDYPEWLYISSNGTHYLTSDDDRARVIVPSGFVSIRIDVEESGDWIFPPPVFPPYKHKDATTGKVISVPNPKSIIYPHTETLRG